MRKDIVERLVAAVGGDIVERLKAVVVHCPGDCVEDGPCDCRCHKDAQTILAATAVITRLRYERDAIDALHRPFDLHGWKHQFCEECDNIWPCDTNRALYPDESISDRHRELEGQA